ncbi:MAG TPA: IreB family regulatory phosphoprotein [Clostridiaceae bacterium]|nr:IreB family regulatory phosphoprotein [Clostridiaceae bacterium]
MNDKETMMFEVDKDNANEAREILMAIYQALKERGYNPVNQIVGYILSGDPTYITNHKNARNLVRKLERDELLEEILKFYLESDCKYDKKK